MLSGGNVAQATVTNGKMNHLGSNVTRERDKSHAGSNVTHERDTRSHGADDVNYERDDADNWTCERDNRSHARSNVTSDNGIRSHVDATTERDDQCHRTSISRRFHDGEKKPARFYHEDIGLRCAESANANYHSYADSWKRYSRSSPNTMPTTQQSTPNIQIGQAFHVQTFTPGPREQIIVRQPVEVFEMNTRSWVRPNLIGEQSATIDEVPRTDSGFSDDDDGTLDGRNDSANGNGLMANGSIPNGDSWIVDGAEEEAQWSQVHWYRDLRRPRTGREHKVEQSSFTQYSEFKAQRKRASQSRLRNSNVNEDLRGYSATPLNQNSGVVSINGDDMGPSPKRRNLGHNVPLSPGELERDYGGWRGQDGFGGLNNAACSSSEGRPCIFSQNGEHFQETSEAEENQVDSPLPMESESDFGRSEMTRARASRTSLAKSNLRGTPSDDNKVVCQVNGLFSLPGFKDTKYNITLGELRRRIRPPENLNRVEMISYLRHAKSSARLLLDRHQLITSSHSTPNILSRVCETEAKLLAAGIHKINASYLPMRALAKRTVEEFKERECDGSQDCGFKLRRRVVDVEITRSVLQELQDALEHDLHAGNLKELELASHSFGANNLINNLKLFDTYFEMLMKHLQVTAAKHTPQG